MSEFATSEYFTKDRPEVLRPRFGPDIWHDNEYFGRNGRQYTNKQIDFAVIDVVKGYVCARRWRLQEYKKWLALREQAPGPHTPSRRIHSAVSPFLRGLETCEVSPSPSAKCISLGCELDTSIHRTRIPRVVISASYDFSNVVCLA
jgi:hypothetical protein